MRKTERAAWVLLLAIWAVPGHAQPVAVTDLADVDPDEGRIERVHGSVGSGVVGVPVAGGGDMDGALRL